MGILIAPPPGMSLIAALIGQSVNGSESTYSLRSRKLRRHPSVLQQELAEWGQFSAGVDPPEGFELRLRSGTRTYLLSEPIHLERAGSSVRWVLTRIVLAGQEGEMSSLSALV